MESKDLYKPRPEVEEFRPPKYSEVAEKSVIAEICSKKKNDDPRVCVGKLREAEAAGITEKSFYIPANKLLFRTITEMANEGADISDIAAMAIRLDKAGELQTVGGAAGLMDIMNYSMMSSNFPKYVLELTKIEKERDVQLRVYSIAKSIRKDGCDFAKIAAELQDAALQSQATKTTRRTRWTAKDAILEANRIFGAQYRAGTHITGTRSGYYRLDDMTGGFNGSTLTVIGARPAMGKTTFALNIARNITMHQPEGKEPVPTLFLSGEMTARDLWNRIISMESQIDIKRTIATHDNDGNTAYYAASIRCQAAPMIVGDISGEKIDEVLNIIRREHAQDGARVVIVDYLQLIKGNTQAAEKNTVDSVAEVSQKLHMIACELDIPVIALAQVNRETDGKTPQLVNLKGSGDIEQAADIVLLLDRPEVHADESMPQDYLDAIRHLTILQISKNRSGGTGKVCFDFMPETFTFSQRPDQTIPKQPSPKNKTKK